MKKKLGMILAVAATAVVTVVSLAGCSPVKRMKAQIDALMEVQAGQSEVAIIDSTMANYLLNKDSSFKDLAIIDLEDYTPEAEEYGVAAQKDKKNLINFVNSRLIELQDTAYLEVAEQFGLTDRTIKMSWTATEVGDWKAQLNDKEQKKVIIAYTLNAPMGMKDDNGNITGFDIELAKKVFEGTGVQVETKLIDWDSKELELNSGYVDLVWNGMTITDERKVNMAVSIPYLTNEQAIVVKKENVEKYKKILDLDGVKIAVEKKSAGQDVADAIYAKIKELKKA